jgi:hypothetical protein
MQATENPLPEGASHEPCAYCGDRPTWPVVWRHDGQTHTVYLCAECDEMEIGAMEGD